jgi:hypothetical protein
MAPMTRAQFGKIIIGISVAGLLLLFILGRGSHSSRGDFRLFLSLAILALFCLVWLVIQLVKFVRSINRTSERRPAMSARRRNRKK